ncbi:cytochrome C oxidase subunit IV family protein [Mycolicibacterium sp. P9-22]|uniref:cytochrome C oxidase subunit IV family protein n=1 Tax=Mycolicibacterium sp. P9-22 TaxID=2024613 RepID=UPI0011EF0BB3|nr:cytochrome C oxidase subunit IV family protein [Mycolicibacterium sp. P9-22]KAA0120561.1 hypothetical protein CIW51_03605 [Mycolicibacterium sp. P9-22]
MTTESRSAVRRHWAVWAVLVAATVSSLVISLEVGDERATVITIMVVAGIKAVLVLWDFMELGRCDRPTRLIIFAWPVIVVAVVLGFYLTMVV